MLSWLRRFLEPATIPEQIWKDVRQRIRYVCALPRDDWERLRLLTIKFLGTKTFEGAQGMVITDTVRIQIAMQACLLILNLGLDFYRGWQAIIVYPGDFRVPREVMDDDGVVHTWLDELSGESWEQGPVVLSWAGVQSATPDTGIVLHEFAHKLDGANGAANGCPPLPPDMSLQQWTSTFETAYAGFCRSIDAGIPVSLDAYAAESPAEFFAIVCEQFFLYPDRLEANYPEIYELLRHFFRQDPVLVLRAS